MKVQRQTPAMFATGKRRAIPLPKPLNAEAQRMAKVLARQKKRRKKLDHVPAANAIRLWATTRTVGE